VPLPDRILRLLCLFAAIISLSLNSKLKTQNSKPAKLVPLLLRWFAANARDLPWRRTRDAYAIWVSEIMLQQTQVKTVLPYWKRWMRELPTIEAVAKASPDKIHKLWEGLGYYTRARNLQKAAQAIVNRAPSTRPSPPVGEKVPAGRMRGNSRRSPLQSQPFLKCVKFPEKYDEVFALPGIGRYTAGAICSIAFNQPTPILDGNVIRVLTRIFGIAENPREKNTDARLWALASDLVGWAVPSPPRRGGDTAPYRTACGDSPPTTNWNCSHFNQSLMELGALICTPRNPQCRICPAKRFCVAFRENRVEELPNVGRRLTTTHRHFVAFIVQRNGHFLVRQRPAGVVNAHLWEFPNEEILDGTFDAKLAAKQFGGAELRGIEPLCTIKHSIMRYRITLEAWHADFGGTSDTSPHLKSRKSGARVTRPSETIGVWRTLAQMDQLAFSSAHKKILSKLRAHSQ